MKEKTKKIVCSILLLMITLSSFSQVFAVEIGSTQDIVNKGICPANIWYRKNGVSIGVLTHMVGFYEDGQFRPSYCLNKNLPGVDDETQYGVVVEDMNNIPNFEELWRVLVNGYPYKTPQEMGLQDEFDAFMATKQAVYRVIDGEPADYFAKDERGNKIVAKIKELVDIGRNGTQTYKDPVINVNATTKSGIDNINKEYISQTFVADSQVDMSTIKAVLNTSSAPKGTYLADINNNAKTEFAKGEKFKVLVPRKNITNEINIQISFDGKCKTYPILFGKAPNESVQDYLLTTDPFVMATARTTMSYSPDFDVEIEKISNGKSEITGQAEGTPLAGATFKIKIPGEKLERILKTDKNGKIHIEGLPLNTEITITEIEAPDYYLKGKDTTFIVEGKYDGDNKKVTVENTPVDIEVNVDKEVDKDEAQGNEIVEYTIDNVKNLSNVKLNNFTLTDYLPKEVRIQKLETGTYNENLKYRITYNTNKRTDIEIAKNLSTTENNIIDFTKEKLSEGEYVTSYTLHFGTVKIGFSNSLQMKVKAKVVEGLVDESTFINNVKVIGHYLEAKAEDKDDVPVKVYENVLKIRKVSKEYNQYTKLPEGSRINAVFELLDENKKYIDTLKVNDKEDYIYKYLETGKTYYLKEISVDPYYVISDKLIEFKFEKNGQIIELEIKNDNVNLIVDVEKEAPAEAQKGEIIDYTFNNIGNYSNTEVSNFIWGDKLPRQVRVQELQTGIWNEELEYEIQYITNKNTNWKNIGEKYKTTENYKIDLTSKSLNLQEDEYVEEFRLVFGKVKAGFEATTTPIVKAKINEDVQNNKIFVNRTYVTADYQKTELKAEDDAHTVIYTKKPNTEKELPKTGIDD